MQEFIIHINVADAVGDRRAVTDLFLETAKATSDYYIDGYSARDGVPYWDSCALNTHKLGDFTKQDAQPYNNHEPVDSSAAILGDVAVKYERPNETSLRKTVVTVIPVVEERATPATACVRGKR